MLPRPLLVYSSRGCCAVGSYDNGHWGFDCLGGTDGSSYNTTNDDFYLRYLRSTTARHRIALPYTA